MIVLHEDDAELIREQLQARRDSFNDTMACVPEIGAEIKKLDGLLDRLVRARVTQEGGPANE